MEKRRSASGTLALIIGFIVFQFGLLIVLNHPAFLRSSLAAFFTDSPSLDLFGMILIFGGEILGLLGLFRLIKSISNDILNTISAQRYETLREITNLRSSLSDMLALIATQSSSSKESAEHKCKFCGAEIEENAIFCSVCNRSQI